MGVSGGNGENILVTPDGARTVRTTHRIAQEIRWDSEFVSKVRGVPFDVCRDILTKEDQEEQIKPGRRTTT